MYDDETYDDRLEPDVAEFAALAAEVSMAFHRTYVTPVGEVSGETATAYALAVWFRHSQPRQETYALDAGADWLHRSSAA